MADNITIRATDPYGLYVDHECTVTVSGGDPGGGGRDPASYTTFGLGLDETFYVAGSATNGWGTKADTVPGWDWSFPSNTTVAPLSGIFMFKNTSAFPEPMVGKRIYKINADWADLEPTEGNYSGIASEFAILNTILTTGQANGLPWNGVQIDVRGTCYSISGLIATDAGANSLVTAPPWLAAYLPNNSTCRRITYPDDANPTVPYVFFNPAHQAYYSRLRLLIDAIAGYTIGTGVNAYKIPAHPMLTGQIVHGGGTGSLGEEAGYGWEVAGQPTSIAEYAKTIRRWAGRYNATTVTDADGITGLQTVDCRPKLEWVGEASNNAQAWVETRPIIESGMGSRGGIVERFLTPDISPRNEYCWTGVMPEAYKNSTGATVSHEYYFYPDETDPRISQLRWYGDQNEEWRSIETTATKGWLTVPEKWQQSYRMAMLGSLARQRNNIAIEHQMTGLHGATPTDTGADYENHGCEGFVNPPLVRWSAVQFGKRPYNPSEVAANETTEAFCCLVKMLKRGSTYDTVTTYAMSASGQNDPSTYVGGTAVIHNWERWLTQREADGATTTALTTEYGYAPWGSESYFPDSKTMDQARKGASIGFRLDNRLRFGTTFNARPVAVKVTFYDNNTTDNWALQYTTTTGLKSIASSPKHLNEGGNVVRTVTFFLTDFVNSSGVNFKLTGNGATPFMFVRVIRT